MTFLDVFLKIIAILGIIAVGTFIIVFLSDLLISVVDNSNGIFFRKNRGSSNRGGSYSRPKMIAQPKREEYEQLTYSAKQEEYKQAPVEQPVRQPAPTPAPAPAPRPVQNEGIDYEKAREEERMAARASIAASSIDKRKAEEDERTAERLRLIEARRREFEAAQKAEAEEEDAEETIDEDEIRRIIAGAAKEEPVKPEPVKKAEEKPAVNQEALRKEIEIEIEERLRKEFDEKHAQLQAQQSEIEERLKAEQEERFADLEAQRAAFEEKLRAENEEKIADIEAEKLAIEEKLADLEAQKIAQEEKLAEEASKLQTVEQSKLAEREQLEKEIEILKKQLETANSTVVSLTQQVNEKPEPEVQVVYEKVITGKGMTKEEIEDKLAVLKQRLKANEKELSANKKDYLPLKRVSMTLANDEKKLRRKEAMVAKKKVMLYGVNNYVDIDEEKAKELAEELDLLEGLKLSVQHCHEVMNANKDRFPILEKTNKILTSNIEGLKADIAELEARLAEFPKDGDDEDEGKKEVAEEKPAKKPVKKEEVAEKKEEPKEEPVVAQPQEVEAPVVETPVEVEKAPVEEEVVEAPKAEEKPAVKPAKAAKPAVKPTAKPKAAKKEAPAKAKADVVDPMADLDIGMQDDDVEALVNAILGTTDKK